MAPGDFRSTLERPFFPYAVQAAAGLSIDSLTLYTGRPRHYRRSRRPWLA